MLVNTLTTVFHWTFRFLRLFSYTILGCALYWNFGEIIRDFDKDIKHYYVGYIISLTLLPVVLISGFVRECELVNNKKISPLWSGVRSFSFGAWISASMVFAHAQLYSLGGLCVGSPCKFEKIESNELGDIRIDIVKQSPLLWDVIHDADVAMYFSVVTWTTVGYGDYVAPPPMRPFVMGEAFTGILIFGFQISILVALLGSRSSASP
jgi:Ion channel